jgi:hypothetical protein
MAMIACFIAGAALVSTRVSPTEIDTDDVGCLPQVPSTFLIHLGMVPTCDVASGVLTPNQNSVTSSNVPYTTPADSTVGMAYPPTSVPNQMHLLSKVFPLEWDNDTNSSPPSTTSNCGFETSLSTTEVPAAPPTPVHPVRGRAEEPRAPIQVSIRVSTSSFSRANSIAGLSLCIYCILRGCAMLSIVSFL